MILPGDWSWCLLTLVLWFCSWLSFSSSFSIVKSLSAASHWCMIFRILHLHHWAQADKWYLKYTCNRSFLWWLWKFRDQYIQGCRYDWNYSQNLCKAAGNKNLRASVTCLLHGILAPLKYQWNISTVLIYVCGLVYKKSCQQIAIPFLNCIEWCLKTSTF